MSSRTRTFSGNSHGVFVALLSPPECFNHVAVVDGFCPSLGYLEEERGLDRTVEYSCVPPPFHAF